MSTTHLEAGNYGDPPSYDSIFGRVRHAQQTSTGSVNFLTVLSAIIVGTLGCTIALGISLAIPVAQIVIGSIHLHDCPAQHYIPIYLIVGGAFGILRCLITLCRKLNNPDEGQIEEIVETSNNVHIVDCFLLAWTVAGAVWVYGIYMPNFDDEKAHNYCHSTVYWLAFVCLTISFVGMVLLICCCCCALLIAAADSS